MNDMNEKIIDIIIKKADILCPDSLVMIGVYGSVVTGDEYEKVGICPRHFESMTEFVEDYEKRYFKEDKND